MIETFNCPSCNGSLDPPRPPAPTVDCPYCGNTVIVPDSVVGDFDDVMLEIRGLLSQNRKIEAIKRYREAFRTDLKTAKTAVEQMEVPIDPQVQVPRKGGGRGCRGCLPLLILLILAIAGVAFYFMQATEEESLASIISAVTGEDSLGIQLIGSDGLFLPGEDGATAELAFMLRDHTDDSMSVAYVDGQSGEQRWRAETLPLVSTAPIMFASKDVLFVVFDTDLRVYDRSSGAMLWEAVLSDRVQSVCESCLMEFGGKLVVRSSDGQVHAYDQLGGTVLWRHRLERSGTGQLYRLGDKLAFVDDDETAGIGLEIVDPATGELIRRLEPRCPHPFFDAQEPDANSAVAVDPVDTSVTFFFGFFDPACVQKIDYESGEGRWNLFVEGYSLSGDTEVLQGRSRFYVTSMEQQLLSVEKDGSSFSSLLEDEDYSLGPLTESGDDILLLKATRSRGTRRDELWAIDSRGGEVLWRHIPQAEEMLETGEGEVVWHSDEGLWHARVDSRGVFVMQARNQPPRLVLETLDVLTGASKGQIERPVPAWSESSYRIELLGWDREAVWLQVDLRRIWAMDPVTAEVLVEWP